jgi:hypothetical protein
MWVLLFSWKEISVCATCKQWYTRDFSAVRLATQGMTHPQRCFTQTPQLQAWSCHLCMQMQTTCFHGNNTQIVNHKLSHIYLFYSLLLLLIFFGQNSLFCVCYEHFIFVPFPCSVYPLSWDSAVGLATGYGLDGRGVGVRVPVGSRIISSPRRPDRLWGPHSVLSNGYRELFPRG